MHLTRARVKGWLVILAAFVGVWIGAKEIWVLCVSALVLIPIQLFVCREILVERRYPSWFAWFSLFLGPMGVLIVLGLPVLPTNVSEDAHQGDDPV